MPYITKDRRISKDHFPVPITPGELNFMITLLIQRYMEKREPNYQTFNDVLGALEGAKLEFYRRVVVPYEDEKIIENGDVYDA